MLEILKTKLVGRV